MMNLKKNQRNKMWTVLEIDQNLLNIFRKDFKKNTSSEAEIYCPKYLVQHFRKNKLKFKEIKLLNNYIFCFNSNFKNSNFLNTIKYLKGFKSCVPGYLNTQKEIIRYIKDQTNANLQNAINTLRLFDALKELELSPKTCRPTIL